ncbi:MAG: rRNA methyltransferase [Bacteroidetes bacterium]|nr:rRNA methyltransferase [Bacteroidota bacterium]
MTSGRHSDPSASSGPPHGLEYFYVDPSAVTGNALHIEDEEYVHLTHVMRRREGDIIGVIDGQGMAYVASITALEKRRATATIQSRHPFLHEHPTPVTLAAAILKNPSRFDTMIEKVTEIGIRSFIPLFTERTIPRHARTERWQKLALAAAKQSGRSIIPRIFAPVSFGAFLDQASYHGVRRWILHEEATDELPQDPAMAQAADGLHDAAAQRTDSHTLLIGPEGGFTGEEVALATAHGYRAVSLGTRRLRSETAAIAAAVRVLS